MKSTQQRTVVVCGASGFVGRAVPAAFDEGQTRLVGLTRRPDLARQFEMGDDYEWRRCDLFSRQQTRRALKGADCGVYLVHSTLPSAHLTQGRPADMDLICADNFARATAHHGVEHIVYVGPRAYADRRRQKTGSPQEIATVLGAYDTPVTALWGSMILGSGGVAVRTLVDLVRRLPLMILPRWTESKTAPVDRRDLVRLVATLLDASWARNKSYQLSGPEVTTYRDLLQRTAHRLGRKRMFVSAPVKLPRLSTRWMASFCSVHHSMIEELVSQLSSSRLADDDHVHQLPSNVWNPRPLDESLRHALDRWCAGAGTSRQLISVQRDVDRRRHPDEVRETEMLRSDDERRIVRSVQRLPLPAGRDARWTALEYARWLPAFMGPFIRVDRDEDQTLRFFIRPFSSPLLVLAFDRDVSHPERQLYWIRGGALARSSRGSRLEFRVVLDRSAILAAVHDFEPRLPWYLYRITQALVHRWIMDRFGNHLQRIDDRRREQRP